MLFNILPILMAAGTAHAAIAALPGHDGANAATLSGIAATAPAAPTPDVSVTLPKPAVLETAVLPAPAATDEAAVPLAVEAPLPDPRQIECVAKVIIHEAGNQPRTGQVAVAQVIRTRLKSGRFADTACGVVKQRGQFFDVDAYNPPRNGSRWATAHAIALDTLSGQGEEVAPGALFFHSAGARMPSRVRIAQIADHIFYR